jgi:hypothetical protein
VVDEVGSGVLGAARRARGADAAALAGKRHQQLMPAGAATDRFPDQFRERRDERECEGNTGATFNQILRLGALDGIHLKWSSSIFARDTGFVFGVGRGELAVPVSSRLGVFAGGGAGENGWGYGEVGVRSFLGGAGTPGTLMLQASLGGAAIFDGPSRETIGGPSVAFGLEWRM